MEQLLSTPISRPGQIPIERDKNSPKASTGVSKVLVSDMVSCYLERNPEERKTLSLLLEQLNNESYEKLISRKNFVGHITASAFVISKKSKRVLLLEHKTLRKMLQPGGHIEASDDGPLGGIYREIEEETGILSKNITYRAIAPGAPQVPFNIDTHHIPANERKNEPAHYHHDFWYLFLVENEFAVEINTQESNSFQWVEWSEFTEDKTFKKVAQKIEGLTMPGSAGHLFEKAYNLRPPKDAELKNTRIILVTHIVQNSFDYILFLRSIFGQRLQVFAKPNSINENVYKQIQNLNIDLDIARRSTDDIIARAPYLKDGKQKSILLDIGGYFCNLVTQNGLNVLGVVEDTENGLREYKMLEEKLKYPVISVARSTLKENEDKLVGESIVHATDTILRSKNRIIDYMACTVIGYGKIGAAVVGKLKKLGINPTVLEKDPQRLVKAINDNCRASSLKRTLSNSEIVFCATGTKSLGIHEFRMLRSGAYVISVTSSDNEFDFSYLNSEYAEERVNQHITKYTGTENYFYLINNGNPVNFLFGSALDGFINLVLSEILLSVNTLMCNKSKYRVPGIYENSAEDRKAIAALWLEEFAHIKETPNNLGLPF